MTSRSPRGSPAIAGGRASPRSWRARRTSSRATPRHCARSPPRPAPTMCSRIRSGWTCSGVRRSHAASIVRWSSSSPRWLATSPGRARDAQRREIALLYLSRLLFLVVPRGEGLAGRRSALPRRAASTPASAAAARFHRRVLVPLFFGTLNTPSAVRALRRARARPDSLPQRRPVRASALERAREPRVLRRGAWRALFDLLGATGSRRARRRRTWSEAAVDPEMLGRAFESLMAPASAARAGVLHAAAARGRSRRRSRPRSTTALAAGRGWRPRRSCAHSRLPGFLSTRRAVPVRSSCTRWSESRARAALGDARPVASRAPRRAHSVDLRRRRQSDGGLAVRAAALAVSGDRERRDAIRLPCAPLPNLDRNIRVGDALAGDGFRGEAVPRARRRGDGAPARPICARHRHAEAHAARALDRAERARVGRSIARSGIARDDAARRDLIMARADAICSATGVRPSQRAMSSASRAARTHGRELRAPAALSWPAARCPSPSRRISRRRAPRGGFDV